MNSNHKKQTPTVPALPVDVIIEIFCRLPVKSLLRFRCLSKQFRSMIDGPDFINRHLQNQSLDQRLIVQGDHSSIMPELYSVDFDSANNVWKLEHPFESWGFDCTLIGSCNGLLALSHCLGISVGLWNISAKKHQILPKFWTDCDVTYPYPNFHHPCEYLVDGFGYDVTTDDYKWVRVVHLDKRSFTEGTVYSLKTNSWRRIDDLPPYHSYSVCGIGVLVGGALNWVVAARDVADEESTSRVLSFDLKGEKFCQVSVPEIADTDYYYFEIVVIRGCLCLGYFYEFEVYKDVLDVWVMKEYGVKKSWSKLFSFTEEKPLAGVDFSCGIKAFTYSKRGDKVLFYLAYGQVVWHDLEKETDECVKIIHEWITLDEGVVINGWVTYISCAAVYVDSLVSPNLNI